MKSYTVLGVHLDTHDSGAAIVQDGNILAAVNEERFSRIKMDGASPRQSIEAVLSIAKLSPKDIDLLVISGLKPSIKKPLAFFSQQAGRVWHTRGKYLRSFTKKRSFDKGRLLRQSGILGLIHFPKVQKWIREIARDLQQRGFSGEVMYSDHDLNHAAGAYFTSGFEKGLVVILEGSSFINASSVWWAEHGRLRKIHETPLPHSLGRYYEVVTAILGFNPKKHGGKITGLSGHGDPTVLYDKVKSLLWIDGLDIRVSSKLFELYDEFFAAGKKLPAYFDGHSREDIAAAFQKRLEDVSTSYVKVLLTKYPSDTLLCSGGVHANVKLNMELAAIEGVKHIYIHPGMGDAGQALGAALIGYSRHDHTFRPFTIDNVSFGPSFSDSDIEKALTQADLQYTKEISIAKAAAALLADNKVVAFFQGRMEYGPRALGNRTIMYPATDPRVNDWLNKRLKRTEFMPFAPVTLEERATDCYDEHELKKCEYTAHFMTIAVRVTPYMKEAMPAAVHVDNTARPQLVGEKNNSVYYRTLKEYEMLTGLPSVINTSFNMHEEPIVCTPAEAINAYLASDLDALAIGPFLVTKQ